MSRPAERASPQVLPDPGASLEQIERRLADLEPLARALDPGVERRAAWRQEVNAHAERFLEALPTAPGFVMHHDGGRGVLDLPVREEGRDLSALLDVLRTEVDVPGINPASGGHLGYIPGGGLYPSALGDFLADVTNRYSGIFYANPGAVRIENAMVRWMADLVGFGPEAGGDLSSGGSIANLTGIVTAREAKGIRAADVERATLYMTPHAHHCVAKALRIAGLGEAPVRTVAVDAQFRMDANALREQVRRDRDQGLNPFLVVASAGTTDTGAIDPLDAIADVAEDEGLWLHVDAAYGGFFLLAPETRDAFPGLDRADSVVLDPHKGLFLPYGSGALVVRDRAALASAHWYRGNYMQDAVATEEPWPADHSPELTRPFRGLRMWLPLQLFGLEPFRAALSEKVWLARYFHERVRRLPHIEVGAPPALSVAVFRWRPPGQDPNEANSRLVAALHEDGRAFLTSTMLNGQFWVRLAVLSFRSHRRIVDTALEVIERVVTERSAQPDPHTVSAIRTRPGSP